MRQALDQSVNIIAIKLGMELGPQAVISEATRFGISTRIPPYPSIYIGSAEVIPLERLWVNPDCGLKTRGWIETEAGLRNMVEAAKRLRAGRFPDGAQAATGSCRIMEERVP